MSDPYASERRRAGRRGQGHMMLAGALTMIIVGFWGIFSVGNPLLGAFIMLCGVLSSGLGIQRIRRNRPSSHS